MSYDISLIAPTYEAAITAENTDQIEVGNMTYNVGPLYYEALPGSKGLNGLDGRIAGEAVPDLNTALAAMIADPDKYEPLVRGTNWGSYEGAIKYLLTLRQKCREYPAYTISVC